MSYDNVIEFWKKMQSDDELQAKVSPLVDRPDEEHHRGAAKIAQEAGFEVTPEEVKVVGQTVAFWTQVGADSALQAKIEAAHARETPQEALEAVVAIAKESGFDLPQEALSKVAGALVAGHDAGGDLGEAELAGVVGGASGGMDLTTDWLKINLKTKWSNLSYGPGKTGAKP